LPKLWLAVAFGNCKWVCPVDARNGNRREWRFLLFSDLQPNFVAFFFSSPCDAETTWFVGDVVKPQDELVLGVIAHNRRAKLAKLLQIRVKAVSLLPKLIICNCIERLAVRHDNVSIVNA
jgi:hypothetical protein